MDYQPQPTELAALLQLCDAVSNTTTDKSERLAFVITSRLQIGVGEFLATEQQSDTVLLALQSFGFLVKSLTFKRLSFADFASVIRARFDMNNPRTAEVARVLDDVHTFNAHAFAVKDHLATLDECSIAALLKTTVGLPQTDENDLEALRSLAFNCFKAGLLDPLNGIH